jgi:hypothetical protein
MLKELEEGWSMTCRDCREHEAEVGFHDRYVLCRECRQRMIDGLPRVRPMSDEELARAVLGGPGIRRPYH